MFADEATIFLHNLNSSITKVKVDREMPVDCIYKRSEDEIKKIALFNGKPLCIGFSFKFYNIKNGDHIFFAPIDPLNKAQQFVSFLTEGNCNFKADKMRRDNNRKDKFILETARLKDQFFQKIEGTVQCHRRIFNKVSNAVERVIDSQPILNTINTIIPPNLPNPCSLELPVFW